MSINVAAFLYKVAGAKQIKNVWCIKYQYNLIAINENIAITLGLIFDPGGEFCE